MKYKIILAIFIFISTHCFVSTKSWHFIPSDVSALHNKSADVRIPYWQYKFIQPNKKRMILYFNLV